MIFGISGLPFSGKKTVVEHLKSQGFTSIEVPLTVLQDAEETKDQLNKPGKKHADLVEAMIKANKTEDWRQNYVFWPVIECKEVEQLVKTGKLMLIRVEAPLKLRIGRSGLDMSAFIETSNAYEELSSSNNLEVVTTFTNNFETQAEFVRELKKFDFNNQELMRPGWDRYFMKLSKVVATRSNCMKRAVGCVIVRDCRIAATGYNGTPFGMINCKEGGCERCNSMQDSGVGLDQCYCIHAEENAVIEGGRTKLQGSTAYITTFPCLMCSKKLVQAGVVRIVYDLDYPMPIVRKFFEKISHVTLEQFII